MPTASDVQAFRSQIVELTDATASDLAALWGEWSWDDPEAVTLAALSAVPDVVWTYQDVAGGIAADVYDLWRAADGVKGQFQASPAELAAEDQILAGVRNAVSPLRQADPDVDAARVLLTGMASRLVGHGASDTIVGATKRDEQAVGWSRVARSGACRFCRMLAGRERTDGRPGGVYRSEKSSRFSAHDHCNCAAVPCWDRDVPEMDVVAYVASSRRQTPADRARVKAYLDENFPE